jgi:hypothetical protein
MKRHLPMFAVLPVLAMGVFGVSGAVHAGEGDHACRQYVPSAGLTIAVDCAQPVAAVIKASVTVTPSTCRRYVPSAKMSIEEPCPEPVAGSSSVAPNAAKASLPVETAKPVGVESGKSERVEPAKSGAAKSNPSAVKPVALKGASASGANCSGILERAQLGGETRHDLAMLREGCSTGG